VDGAVVFPPAWFAAGLVDAESAAAFARYAAADPAAPPRHWRWLAFRDFIEEHTPLSAQQCRSLFELAEHESDAGLAGAMICALLYQPACPAEVIQLASKSGTDAVRRIAIARNPVAVRPSPPTPRPSA
jgi:hypothetical protein